MDAEAQARALQMQLADVRRAAAEAVDAAHRNRPLRVQREIESLKLEKEALQVQLVDLTKRLTLQQKRATGAEGRMEGLQKEVASHRERPARALQRALSAGGAAPLLGRPPLPPPRAGTSDAGLALPSPRPIACDSDDTNASRPPRWTHSRAAADGAPPTTPPSAAPLASANPRSPSSSSPPAAPTSMAASQSGTSPTDAPRAVAATLGSPRKLSSSQQPVRPPPPVSLPDDASSEPSWLGGEESRGAATPDATGAARGAAAGGSSQRGSPRGYASGGSRAAAAVGGVLSPTTRVRNAQCELAQASARVSSAQARLAASEKSSLRTVYGSWSPRRAEASNKATASHSEDSFARP